MIETYLFNLGYRTLSFLDDFGRATVVLFRTIIGKPNFIKGSSRLLAQIYSVGVLSLIIIVI